MFLLMLLFLFLFLPPASAASLSTSSVRAAFLVRGERGSGDEVLGSGMVILKVTEEVP